MSKSWLLDLSCRKCRASFLVMLASAITYGCSSSQAPAVERFDLRGPASIATVTVENRRLTDISVYAVAGATRIRLGAVQTLSSKTFTVPRMIPIPSEVELLANAMADDEHYSTPPVAVRPGDSILFIVEDAMKFSMLLKR